MSTAAYEPANVVRDLKELRELTGGPDGARRLAWTDDWVKARDFLRAKLDEIPGVTYEMDECGNIWATLPGARSESVAVGSHVDAVPRGGWLDGVLGVMAGLEVLRAAAAGGTPPCTVKLVDWADEEGARFGRSLLGSSAFAGTLEIDDVKEFTDKDGIRLDDALKAMGVDLAQSQLAKRRIEDVEAYLELHIEQGPVLESEGLAVGAVLGTVGVERYTVTFRGQAAHAGSTPMLQRKDTFSAAARFALLLRDVAIAHEGVSTIGNATCTPGVVTAVPGVTEILVDQRHIDADVLAAMNADARAASEQAAAEFGCTVGWEQLWRIPPIPFDPALIEDARAAVREVTGTDRALPSGPLHDAAEMARMVPTVMLFASSINGLSHCPEEDTPEEHLLLAAQAFGISVGRAIDRVGAA